MATSRRAGVDHVPAIGGQAHTAGRGPDPRHLGAVVDPRAGGDRHAEQAVGEAIGVDLALAVAPDAAVGHQPHPPLQLSGLEPLDGEAALLAERAFRAQPRGLAVRGGQVESGAAREAAVEPVRLGPAQRRDVVESGPAGVPGGHGPIGANVRLELGQLRIGLVHQQPGARRGTAGASIVRVHDHDVAAGVGQAQRGDGAGHPGADHHHVASLRAIEWRIGGHQPALHQPERRAGAQCVVVGLHAGRPNSDGAGRWPSARSV